MRNRLLVAAAALAVVTFLLYPSIRVRHSQPHLPARPMQGEPLTMLWAWETPEDIRALSPDAAGVAFLSREVQLSDTAQIHSRHQPLLLPANIWLMAVVRLEPTALFRDTPQLREQAAAAILGALEAPHIHALQIDFDATASQRAFYADILARVRAALPPNVPLSITALVSWCSRDSWLASLPAGAAPDEAVPMFFRMGGPAATRAIAPRSTGSIATPLCAASAGIATDEAWPDIHTGQRVYVFRTGPWTADDITRLNARGYPGLRKDIQP